ncbi:MAG TPA: peptide ABC transporter substrate-binding protein [Bdellovibrio sp.]|uniref:peptide ABC transporter substrate-binding protein n=1 Tax=Bdellovibrio sp. TaxID=28201 RepID=UPI002F119C2B
MRLIPALLLSLFFSTQSWGVDQKSTPSVFRLHLSNEPSNLDPNKQKTSASSYLLGNLFRNIFTFDDAKGLQPDLGEACVHNKDKSLTCKLKKDLYWSDSTPLTAEDFIRTYKKILDPKTAAPRADLLFKIKNAKAIYRKEKSPDALGITAPDKWTLKFEFSEPDPDFEYNLTNFILAPTKEDLNIFSGPYKIKEWKKGQKLVLEPNLKYKGGNSRRPLVEFLFVEEDTVALQLYEKNELQFLRRLPTLFIPSYKDRKDFYWIPVTRFDYIGFGPELATNEDIRKAFTYSLNYEELQRIFSSKGKPGCAGLPDSWFPKQAPCFDFDLKKVPDVKSSKIYTFMFSTLGGEDHKRATEWLQDQWRKNAHLQVNLQVKENKVYLHDLENNTPPLFRKGVAVDRPTCYAALETFSKDSPENFIRLNSPEYQKILETLGRTTNTVEQRKLCLSGVEYLMNRHLIIPMGAIHFSILAKGSFSGWKLNQMNQLDLSDLHPSP